MVYSASCYTANIQYNDSMFFMKKQIVGLVIGLIFMVLIMFFDYHKIERYKWIILGVSVLLLVLVFIPGIGVANNGARRWIRLPGFTIQPSEIAKFAFVIWASSYLSKNFDYIKTFKGILPVLAVGGVYCLLIILEPNMSITMCMAITMVVMLFVGGIRAKHFAMLGSVGLMAVPALIIAEPYRLNRLVAFLNPWLNPKTEGYQLIQSLYSLGAGGLFGVGLFNSRQKYMFLPFAESDFIFSIIGEELGLFGCIILMILFGIIIFEGIKIAMHAVDRFGCYLATGITTIIASQVLINIAVVTGSIPPTGVPLPFISCGGTALVVFMAGIGVLLNIDRQSKMNVMDFNGNVVK
ncbi:MAG: putative lipid II flippase FtsW [Clostridiales bacterium]|nr:putative lipid II flippase FtsW [Candidatus Apopatousia equi]